MRKEILIWEVVDYVSKKNGKQMFSFNQGQFHLSYAQMQGKGIDVPQLLQGTTMVVEFYAIGEELLNGKPVTDAEKIVKNFTPEVDKTLLREVALEAQRARVANWAKAAVRRIPLNTTGTVSDNASTNEQSAMSTTPGTVITRNSQLNGDGTPIDGGTPGTTPQYDDQGNLIEGAANATAASIGQPAGVQA